MRTDLMIKNPGRKEGFSKKLIANGFKFWSYPSSSRRPVLRIACLFSAFGKNKIITFGRRFDEQYVFHIQSTYPARWSGQCLRLLYCCIESAIPSNSCCHQNSQMNNVRKRRPLSSKARFGFVDKWLIKSLNVYAISFTTKVQILSHRIHRCCLNKMFIDWVQFARNLSRFRNFKEAAHQNYVAIMHNHIEN